MDQDAVDRPGTPSLLRAINDRTALRLLADRGPLSRTQLGSLAGLSKPTASQLMDRLETAGLVEAVPDGQEADGAAAVIGGGAGAASGSGAANVGAVPVGNGTPGRTARLYRLRGDAAHVAGLDVTPARMVARICDLTGRIVGEATLPTPGRSAVGTVDRVRQALTGAAAVAGLGVSDLHHVVIGLGGAFDPTTGRIGFARHLSGWHEPDLLGRLRAELAPPGQRNPRVDVENDVNLAAVAEQAIGVAARPYIPVDRHATKQAPHDGRASHDGRAHDSTARGRNHSDPTRHDGRLDGHAARPGNALGAVAPAFDGANGVVAEPGRAGRYDESGADPHGRGGHEGAAAPAPSRPVRDFVVIWIADGIGAAVVIDGRLHRGATGGAGEVGYMPVPGAPVVRTIGRGTNGGFQTLAGAPAVLKLARQHGFSGTDAPGALARAVEAAADPAAQGLTSHGSAAHDAATREAAGRMLDELADRLATGLAPIVAVLDPEMIVLTGAVLQAGRAALRDRIADALQGMVIPRPRLVVSAIADNPVLTGAIHAALAATREAVFNRFEV